MASGDTLFFFTPLANEPPATAFALMDVRNGHPVLSFSGTVDEEAVFSDLMSTNYDGGGVTVTVGWIFTSATSGTLRTQVAFETSAGLDLDTDSFAAFQSAGLTAGGTSGIPQGVAVTFTNGAQMDSVGAGSFFRLKVRRDADGTSGTDDITTRAELLFVLGVET